MSIDSTDISLKEQFNALQDQQIRKLQRRKDLKENSNFNKANQNNGILNDNLAKLTNKTPATKKDNTFGIDDDLNLQLDSGVDDQREAYLSAELVDHLNNEIRELRDEAGRLRKLLNEREFELKQLKKKKEADRDVITGITNENAASKIVELSKKLRETTADLEGEKTKSRVLVKKCHDLELQSRIQASSNASDTESQQKSENTSPQRDEWRALQEKLRQSEMKTSELRNNNLVLKNDLKMAQKIISQEVGDGVTIQSLSSVPGNWKGRAEQIVALNNKIAELKSQLDGYQSPDINTSLGMRSSRQQMSVDKHRDQIHKLEKDRKESQQRAAEELKALQDEFSSHKQKLEAAKARNKVLTGEVKSLKQQMQTLMDKGHNDNELIAALMKQQSTLREMLTEAQNTQSAENSATSLKVMELSAQKQQDDAVVSQLREIIMEKEEKLLKLEHDIQQIQINKLQDAQKEGLKAIFKMNHEDSLVDETVPEDGSCSVPSSAHSTQHESMANGGHRKTNIARPSSSRPPSCRMTPRKTPSPSPRRQIASRSGPSPTPQRQSSAHQREGPQAAQNNELLQYKSLCQAAEVERDKLSELVQVLQQRLNDSNKSILDLQNDAIQLKRRNVLLEKNISKFNLEQNPGKRNNTKLNTARSADGDTDDLQTSLLIQQDENAALKAALASAMKAKEQDLKAYSEMMESTRSVFLQALHQHVQ